VLVCVQKMDRKQEGEEEREEVEGEKDRERE
jgi:hypothetical protein